MANVKLTDKTALGAAPAAGDFIHIVDVSNTSSDAAGTSFKIAISDLMSYAGNFLADGSVAMTGTLQMGANNITTTGTVDGRNVSTDGTNQDAMQTALGIAAAATDFGAFSGSLIADGVTAKVAFQTLETAVEALDATGMNFVVADITARDALTPVTGDKAFVTDASADGTVTSGSASYVWNGAAWIKFAEAESMDISLTAANIVNVASGNLVATDVQAALNELQTELDAQTSIYAANGTLTGARTVTQAGNSISLSGGAFEAIGSNTLTSATSFAVGTSNAMTGANSVSFGSFNTLGGQNGFGNGLLNTITGNYGAAFGLVAQADHYGQFTVGTYAQNFVGGSATAQDLASNPSFVVGNGTGFAARSVAMVLTQGGKLHIGNESTSDASNITGNLEVYNFDGTNRLFDVTESKGFKPQSLTTTARDALTMAAADEGYIIWNETTNEHNYWDGSAWQSMAAGAAPNTLYTADGTLSAARVVTQGGNDLTITSTGGNTVFAAATGNLTLPADIAIAGNTTLGDATGDTVTSNADAWTFPLDTAVTLSGGVNALNFDSNTLSIDATNNRIGIGSAAPTSKVDVVGSADEVQLRVIGNATQTSDLLLLEANDGTDALRVVLGSTDVSGVMNVASGGTVTLNPFGTAAGETTALRFNELSAGGSNSFGMKAVDSMAADVDVTLPSAQGAIGSVMVNTDGNGALEFEKNVIALVKTVDQQQTNNATVLADDDLGFAVASGETWLIQLDFSVTALSNAPDFKMQIIAPAGSDVAVPIYRLDNGSFEEEIVAVNTDTANIAQNTNVKYYRAYGFITAAAAGSISFGWSQNSSNANATIVRKGSTLTAYKKY